MTKPHRLKEWQDLTAHAADMQNISLSALFAQDHDRFTRFSAACGGMLVDYSKNLISDNTLKLLQALAEKSGVEKWRKAMFSGEKINNTEDRAVLHTALRDKNAPPKVQAVLQQMKAFADSLRTGEWRGYSGKPITDIVNIGIGGSSLGPQAVTEALKFYHHPRLRAHFVSNVEASDMENTLRHLSAETTLFVIASKTFTTVETMQNAHVAREWFLKAGSVADIPKHFVAVSTNVQAAETFGIDTLNIFPFWDWVGGRYSVWSAIGLTVMLMIGVKHFQAFLAGAHEMDEHFKAAPFDKNIPMLLGMIGIWYRNFRSFPAYGCIPYHAGLARLPAWLQQLDMESNGKFVDRDGTWLDYPSGPIVFGGAGTDVQHSFFQWLHQSPTPVPLDIIAVVKTLYGTPEQQRMLLANALAQGEALMLGQENIQEPHRHFPGNRPSTTILLDELTPHHLGMLLALYEHKVFVQGIVWNINSFDQWGVELGKTAARSLQNDLTARKLGTHDSSTTGLLNYIYSRSGD